ncbi:hypothetical protein E4T56_gene1399 [Termitomyces sp. T112]|nr:hypothetical protein E4T56_gene1399 [Termitomyces sp. T112]
MLDVRPLGDGHDQMIGRKSSFQLFHSFYKVPHEFAMQITTLSSIMVTMMTSPSTNYNIREYHTLQSDPSILFNLT